MKWHTHLYNKYICHKYVPADSRYCSCAMRPRDAVTYPGNTATLASVRSWNDPVGYQPTKWKRVSIAIRTGSDLSGKTPVGGIFAYCNGSSTLVVATIVVFVAIEYNAECRHGRKWRGEARDRVGRRMEIRNPFRPLLEAEMERSLARRSFRPIGLRIQAEITC